MLINQMMMKKMIMVLVMVTKSGGRIAISSELLPRQT